MFRKGAKSGANSMLHVRVLEAKNLVAIDAGNTSDPYVTLKVGKDGKQKHQTKTISANVNPVWDEHFTFGVTPEDQNEVLVVKIYDANTFRDAFLGRALIELASLAATGHVSGWFPLLDEKGEKAHPGSVFLKIAWDAEFTADESEMFTRRVSQLTLTHDPDAQQQFHNISVAVCSWNVGNAAPPDNLGPWIPKEGYRLIVIGGQECNYAARKGYSSCNDDWIGTVKKYLGDAYTLVKQHYLWEMRMLVFCESSHAHLISNVCAASEATGIAHVLGNKGGVAISMSYGDTSLCFINSHLAAHQTKCKARNDNFKEIVEGVNVGFAPMDVLNQFHHVIWMGDLNYRLDWGGQHDKETPTPEAFAAMCAEVEAEKFEELYQSDQLRREIAAGNVFHGFTDLQPKFKPTFKVERNELLKYKAQRLPAWCDRVLYRSLPKFHMNPTGFTMTPEILTSDHKPVRATFDIEVFDMPSGQDDAQGDAFMAIRGLKGANLNAADLNGLSDPYVVFVAPFLVGGKKQTPHIPNTLNPVWEDSVVPQLPLAYNGMNRLRMQHLMIAVVDRDVGSEDDFIGGGALMMRDFLKGGAAAVHDQWQPFHINLTCGGHPAGTLSGELKIHWFPKRK